VDKLTTSWGGSVLPVASSGKTKYWMFAAEMAQRCSLGAWTTNSQVVTAVSDTPLGPFVRQAVRALKENCPILHLWIDSGSRVSGHRLTSVCGR
jgi:hypothetical protein